MTVNRIVTKGMGMSRGKVARAGLITQGYGGTIFTAVLESARVVILHGRSASKRVKEEIIISAKLIRVNGTKSKNFIQGSVTVILEAFRKTAKILISEIKSSTRDVIQIFINLKKKK